MLGPREVFDRFQQATLAGTIGFDDLAEDVVIEWPFAPGGPARVEGRSEFVAFATPSRQALPVRFDEFRDVVVHETADPEVVVAEYTLVGTHLPSGRELAAPFVMVLRVRDGELVFCREYQNPLAMAEAAALAS
ncbi:nuclear transport factor 2 family protein [Tenggerimyces flavus]|uniref:Nuclear transport factor 2 family protein n=1 Tax=Tenggerimyces flavus TaxID=1708749 RepID=A0ABV7Y4L9_9ACTN|nr:nuclear transport factor 2 family protein [Tenggerimyces flavus]MBM7788218.1 ketosteroid isomerase-like protein [Tenggerimyces flavus]